MIDKKNSTTIKKYANRRLYNTATSSYVTLEDLSVMVKNNEDFNVYDAKSSEDITRSVLAQIIMEEENKSGQQNLLPTSFLRQLIGFYGNNLQWMVPKYLENSMDMLSNNQDQIQDHFKSSMGSMFPFGSTFEEMSKQNLSMFENTMRMISPFGTGFDVSAMAAQTKPLSEDNKQNAPIAAAPAKKSCSTSSCAPKSMPSCSIGSNNSKPQASSENKSAPAPIAPKQESNIASITNLKTKKEASKKSSKKENKKKNNEAKAPNTPMPNVASNAASNSGADDMQHKIANLQKQLADLAKSRA